MDETRPDPSALLQFAKKTEEKRGRLKIFLGAAPGVGKTYAMLSAAKKMRDEQHDIVIGLIETHGRQETEKLLANLTILPREKIDYKGKQFTDLNLSLALQRHPEIILIDELAHSNIPGSKHNKRYLDVLELLDAGISVYTTLNVQHIESLNDDIEQVTGVKVRETVPDSILEDADEIVVIDLTPDELIQRLREGKIYVPDMAQRAVQNFFSLNNIAALRELTFRAAAKHAGQELTNYKQVHGIEEPWSVNERIMVCLGPTPLMPRLIRMAARIAKRHDAKFIALYIETPGKTYRSHKQLEQLNRHKLYAQQQGAEIITLDALNKASAIIDYAKANNVTQIVMGKSTRPRFLDRIFGSIVHEVIRQSDGITVHVITDQRPPNKSEETNNKNSGIEKIKLMPFFKSFLLVVLVGWIAHFFKSDLTLASDTMIFLLAIIFSAFRYGLYPSLLAAILSFVIYIYFYLPPYFKFQVTTLSQSLTFIVFIIVSITISQLAGRARASIKNANRREYITSVLYTFSQALSSIDNQQEIIQLVIKTLTNYLQVPVALILPDRKKNKLDYSYPKEIHLHKKDWAAAKWSWEHKKPCGRGTETLSGVEWYYYPMYAAEESVSVVAIKIQDEEDFFHPDNQYLFLSIINQASVALAKMNLEVDREKEKLSAEKDRLRQVLLSSVSHDFRTPLAAIQGVLSSLLAYPEKYNEAAREDLLQMAHDEVQRLTRYINNLLNMTKLEAGALELNRKPTDIAELLQNTCHHMAHLTELYAVQIDAEKNLPLIMVDPVLTQQVFINLLENAVKYSPEHATIKIELYRENEFVFIDFIDQGRGVKPEDQERVFDLFYRADPKEGRDSSFGMGLAICRGILRAQQAEIEVLSEGLGRGSTFRVKFLI